MASWSTYSWGCAFWGPCMYLPTNISDRCIGKTRAIGNVLEWTGSPAAAHSARTAFVKRFDARLHRRARPGLSRKQLHEHHPFSPDIAGDQLLIPICCARGGAGPDARADQRITRPHQPKRRRHGLGLSQHAAHNSAAPSARPPRQPCSTSGEQFHSEHLGNR